jgi:hypothetical protein
LKRAPAAPALGLLHPAQRALGFAFVNSRNAEISRGIDDLRQTKKADKNGHRNGDRFVWLNSRGVIQSRNEGEAWGNLVWVGATLGQLLRLGEI